MGRSLASIAAALVVLSAGPAAALPLYEVTRGGAIRRLDPNDYSVLDSKPITIGGVAVYSGNGLTRNQLTGDLFAIVQENVGDTGRQLVTVDPATGAATVIGNTTDKFAGIAFDSTGTLYGATGFGAATRDSLFTLSLVDATPTLLTALSPQKRAESIAFNPLDGLLYRVSASGTNAVFQKIDLGTLVATNIPLVGDSRDDLVALTFDPRAAAFLVADGEDNIFRLTTSGQLTRLGTLSSDQAKGLAFVPEPSTGVLVGLGLLAGLSLRRRCARSEPGAPGGKAL